MQEHAQHGAPAGWQMGTASRWQPGYRCTAHDLMRVIPTAEGLLLAMANAGESGFHNCWPQGSRLALDLFEAATAAHRAERATVEQALRMVSAQFVEAANRP